MAKFIDVKVKFDFNRILAPTRRQEAEIKLLPQRALQYFIAQTPIDKGYARRNTSLERGNTIHADYAYAERLDTGYSKQAPKGMTKPTEDWLRKEFRRIFRRP